MDVSPRKSISAVSDLISLRGLRIMAICGALPEEKERAQPFDFDIDVEADLTAAGSSDDLDDTINYGALSDDIVAAITGEEFTLLERLAQRVVEVVFTYEQATGVTVEVRKVRPPVPHPLDTSGVTIRRTR